MTQPNFCHSSHAAKGVVSLVVLTWLLWALLCPGICHRPGQSLVVQPPSPARPAPPATAPVPTQPPRPSPPAPQPAIVLPVAEPASSPVPPVVPQLAPQSPPPPVIERHPGVGKPVEVFGGTAIVTGRLPPDAVHPARAFDRNSTTDVEEEFADHPSAPGQVASIAFVYRPGHERAILAYAITSSEAAPSGSDPMTWRLIGVMADGSEHLLDQRQGEAFSARTERRVFTIAGPSLACFSYRLDVSAVADGGSRLRLAEIEFINPR